MVKRKVTEVCSRLERDLEILGVAAIEDRLQVQICPLFENKPGSFSFYSIQVVRDSNGCYLNAPT
jgi:hypothetical protein